MLVKLVIETRWGSGKETDLPAELRSRFHEFCGICRESTILEYVRKVDGSAGVLMTAHASIPPAVAPAINE